MHAQDNAIVCFVFSHLTITIYDCNFSVDFSNLSLNYRKGQSLLGLFQFVFSEIQHKIDLMYNTLHSLRNNYFSAPLLKLIWQFLMYKMYKSEQSGMVDFNYLLL